MRKAYLLVLGICLTIALASTYSRATEPGDGPPVHANIMGPPGEPGTGPEGPGCPAAPMAPPHRPFMHKAGLGMWKNLPALGLSDKQREALREIESRAMKNGIRKRADLATAGVDLTDLVSGDKVDMMAVQAKVKEIASLEADLRISHIKAMEEAKAVLTPEQRKKLKETWGPCDRRMAGRPIPHAPGPEAPPSH